VVGKGEGRGLGPQREILCVISSLAGQAEQADQPPIINKLFYLYVKPCLGLKLMSMFLHHGIRYCKLCSSFFKFYQ
jgi:hypothetical protein